MAFWIVFAMILITETLFGKLSNKLVTARKHVNIAYFLAILLALVPFFVMCVGCYTITEWLLR
jgi:hypothetical protein